MARRAIKRGKNPLCQFLKRGAKPPKHEYYLAMMARALKKAIRVAFTSDNLPTGGIFNHLHAVREAVLKWNEFRAMVLEHPTLLHFARTEAGPAIDGKSKRSLEDSHFPSFNKHFTSSAVH